MIDSNDPDCIVKIKDGKTLIWFPVYWIHVLSIVSVPARGRQIAYNDSGEADEYVPEIDGMNIIWIKNTSSLAQKGETEGFIKRYDDDQIGMHFTGNKTSKLNKGYDIPWMPSHLAYWLIRLRKWQNKYNPITEPTPWIECKNTFLNEKQLFYKQSNCFLFRYFNEKEPGIFQKRLDVRLSAALYYSQPRDVDLAQLTGNANTLSHYTSKYTPHSMRVSLITAYAKEFGLPIEIIMKIVGHSSIVMTIYYYKTSSEELRHRLSMGEKNALKNKAYVAQRMIEQNRIDNLKHELVSNSESTLANLSNKTPAGNFLFRDYGICPVAGARCKDGGELIKKSAIRSAVPNAVTLLLDLHF